MTIKYFGGNLRCGRVCSCGDPACDAENNRRWL